MSSIVVDIFTDQSESTLNVVWKRFNSVEVDDCNGQMTYGSCSVVRIWKGAYGVRTLPKCHAEPVCHKVHLGKRIQDSNALLMNKLG